MVYHLDSHTTTDVKPEIEFHMMNILYGAFHIFSLFYGFT